MSGIQNNSEEEKVREVLPYKFYEVSYTSKQYHFYLSSVIEEPHKYADMIHIIQSASATDAVIIHLNCPGGYLSTGMQIINAMRSTEAHCIGVIESEAASMASLIFLACDEFIVHDYSTMMIHNFSGGAGNGKGHEMAAAIQATTESYQLLAKDMYKNFLKPAEMKRIFDGADLYLHAAEIRERLKAMVEKVNKPAKPKTS